MQFAGKIIYQGEWLNDEIDGKGKFIYSDSSTV